MAASITRLRQLSLLLKRPTQPEPAQCHSLSTQPQVIQVTPSVSLFDQKVHIKIQGIPSKSKVTLHAWTEQLWRKKAAVFTSCGHYVTSDQGDLDLNRDVCVGGTYSGLDPMGLFWSMRPSPSGPQNIRLVVRNGDDPVLYTLSVYLGHISLVDLVAKETTLTPLCSTIITRLKRSADVRRIPVREGNVRGTLFLPPGDGPHPGVIDMFGAAGGLIETRASLLASHGFAVLALAFFRYEDLPDSPEHLNIDYFEEAVSWLSSHGKVKKEGIGIVGVSTGAMLASFMARQCPQVKAVVQINGPPALTNFDFYRKDGTLFHKALKLDITAGKMTSEGLDFFNIEFVSPEHYIPVWESSAHILNLTSDDDRQIKPRYADELYNLYPEDKRHLMQVVHYPRAGHLLEPPYNPMCRTCWNPVWDVDILWGGYPEEHAAAQEDSWNRILAFLSKHL